VSAPAQIGDVILVGPGYYHETVYVNVQNLYIFGAQAGKDARTRYESGQESVVDASPGATGSGGGAAFFIAQDGVVIDGFTIQGGTSVGGAYGSGICFFSQGAIEILDNIIQNNAIGLYMNYPSATLVEYNLFQNNNNGAAGSSILGFGEQSGIGVGAYGLAYATTIAENAFEGNLGAAMYMLGTYYIEITKNTSESDGSFVVFYDCEHAYFNNNQGKDFGAKGVRPVFTYTAEAAIDLAYHNWELQIDDNLLDKGKLADYNGIAFSTHAGVDDVCVYCQVSNNTITRFAGNGIVAEAHGSSGTLEDSMISHNDVEDNGKDGIAIRNAPVNGLNAVFDNKAKGNGQNDCEDDTANGLTAGTYNTWFNNIGSYSYPEGLCASSGRWH
jgi:parallel beta-helix repeat protein